MAKVLLIEDNEMNRDMLKRRLERRGFEVLVAVDGSEGSQMADALLPDIVLLDMSLPIMDGWQVAGYLKSNQRTKTIPLVALTAHAMRSDREKALAAGCDDYDTKPIELDRLLGKIDALLQHRPRP